MKATYKFCEKQVEGLPLTLAFTADLPEWRKIEKCLLAVGDGERIDLGALRPLQHCISNLVKAIDDATGNSYRTRGYSYEAEQESPGQDAATTVVVGMQRATD